MMKTVKAILALAGIAFLGVVEIYNLMGFGDFIWRGILP